MVTTASKALYSHHLYFSQLGRRVVLTPHDRMRKAQRSKYFTHNIKLVSSRAGINPRPFDAQPPDTAPQGKLSLIKVGGKQLPWGQAPQMQTKRCNRIMTTTTLYPAWVWSFPGHCLFKFHKSCKTGSMYPMSQRSERAGDMPKITQPANEGRSHNLNSGDPSAEIVFLPLSLLHTWKTLIYLYISFQS